ncbi:MAG: diguanylate cyclase [Bdellovibrionales bacterium]|nr:diguanylate cyclase [Bdellovibrionales bacterium]
MNKPNPKILCVDDEPGVLESLSRLLKKDFQVFTALSGEQGIEVAKANPDLAVIVSDYRMPGMNGVLFLREMKTLCPTAARTILSGQIDIHEISNAINTAEIHRFFLKPWENDYLKLQIHEAVQTHINLSEKTHFKYLSITDPITGLTNHRFFQDQLRKTISENQLVSLIMLDVDHFKSFNDRYGHPEGDQLLSEISQTLLDLMHAEGTASRYGGEEFSLILPNFTAEQAFKYGETLRQKISKKPMRGPGREAFVSVSLGIATYPTHANSPEELIEKADKALYLSKGQGRNKTTIIDNKSK